MFNLVTPAIQKKKKGLSTKHPERSFTVCFINASFIKESGLEICDHRSQGKALQYTGAEFTH